MPDLKRDCKKSDSHTKTTIKENLSMLIHILVEIFLSSFSSGACVIKLITAIMKGHMTVKYVSVL